MKKFSLRQFSYFDDQKDITKNFSGNQVVDKLNEIMVLEFRRIHLETTRAIYNINLSKKGKVNISHNKVDSPSDINLSHDHQKTRILSLDNSLNFLQKINIATLDGKIKADRQDKFVQINEFLRLIEKTDVIKMFSKSPINIVDLGCGNAYLTFATYHYFNNILNIPAQLTGVDIKADLLEKHRKIVSSLHWNKFIFQESKIVDFEVDKPPDIVLSLHACDTATDETLYKAVKWQSKMIFSSPCCHHNLQVQLSKVDTPPFFKAIFRHNILRERMGDILTDTFRALILKIMGYQTDVIQFAPLRYTAKNLMIRAVKSTNPRNKEYIQEYRELKEFCGVTPYLEKLFKQNLSHLTLNPF